MVLSLFFLIFAVAGIFWVMTIPAKAKGCSFVDCRAGICHHSGEFADPVTTWGNWGSPDYYRSFMVAAKSCEPTNPLG